MKKILALALVAYLGSVLLGYLLFQGVTHGAISQTLLTPEITNAYFYMVVYLVLTGLLILSFLLIPKIIKVVIKYYFLFIVFAVTLLYVNIIVSSIYGIGSGELVGVLAGIVVCFIYYRTWYRFFNFWGLYSTILSASVFGLEYSLPFMLLNLTFFCFYDYIAVFITRHMQFLVGAVMDMDKIPQLFIFEGRMEDIKARFALKNQKAAKTLRSSQPLKSNTPAPSLLGLGDLIIPSWFAVVLVPISLGLALVVALAAFAGLLLNFRIIKKYSVGLPAIPLLFSPQAAVVAIYFGLFSPGISYGFLYILGGIAIVPLVYLIIGRTADIFKSRMIKGHNVL